MKILAIMQCQWFRDPDKVRRDHERLREQRGDDFAEKYRRRLIHYALFAGCKSGRVLRQVFGELCDRIVWEEASREIGGQSSACFKADPAHIRKRIEEEEPDIIICFGKVAGDAVAPLPAEWSFRGIYAPHPAARHATVIEELKDAKLALDIAMLEAKGATP